MKLPSFTRHAVFAIFAIGIITLSLIAGRVPSDSSSDSSRHTQSMHSSSSQTPQSGHSQQPGSAPGNVSRIPQPNPAPILPATIACKFLNMSVAQSVLGSDAVPDSSRSVNGTQTADIAVSTCVFVNASEVATLVLHTALTSLGASENAVAFGSDRPSGVTGVSGYGQVAYWDPATGELNILDNNNWLALSRSHGSIAADSSAVIALAQHMKAEL